MSWSLAEVQTILANLKATYSELSLQTAGQISSAGKQAIFVQLKAVRTEIEQFTEIEAQLLNGSTAQSGVAYAFPTQPGTGLV